MIAIDFDKAETLGNGIGELSTNCEGVVTACKGIDAGRVSSFSPGAEAATVKIQSGMGSISGLLSNYHSTYLSSIAKYRELYEKSLLDVNNTKKITSLPNRYTIIGPTDDGKMLRVTVNGREFCIANTSINCIEYEQFVSNARTYQNAGVGGGQCQTLAQIYAVDMMRGSNTTARQIENPNGLPWSPYIRMENTKKSENSTTPITDFTYNELLNGRPVALQVTQVNSEFGERHWVTVVGFDSSVKSASDLNADTILVMDCVDGKIQTLSQSRAQGGHERDLFKWNGVYQVNGATSEFLQKEVYRG